MCSPKAAARDEERRRWRPHQVQGSDGLISEEGQPAVLGSHPEFKELAVLGGPGRGGASMGGAAGGRGGRCDAGSEQRGGGGGATTNF